MIIPSEHYESLQILYKALKDSDIKWVITGSLGFALHGMNVSVNDIDIQTDKHGAFHIANIFRSNIVTPIELSESKKIRSYLGELNINGVKIEIMGDLQKKLSSGNWECPVSVEEHLEIIEYKGMKLPVLSLEYEEQAYRTLGRIEKANRIREWLTMG